MLRQRVLTALVLIPVVVVTVFFTNTFWFAVIFGVVICLGAWEWIQLSGIRNLPARIGYVLVSGILLVTCYFYMDLLPGGQLILLAVLWWLFMTALIVAVQKQVIQVSGSRYLKALAGLIVLIPAWLSLLELREDEYIRGSLVMFLFVLIWVADSAAYFTGKRWGKSPLCSRISPGKTVEGVVGALFSAVVLALPYAIVNNVQGLEITVFIILCLLTVLVSIVGDITVSMLKRAVNLKDSGQLLPGHGGVLDRIDSLTAAAPVFYTGLWLWDSWS